MRALALFCLMLSFALHHTAQAGYTLYWKWLKSPPPEKLAECLAEMKLIVEADQDIISGEDGSGKYLFTTARIVFNGIGQASHEPFDFPGQPGFNFCKTQWKLYDRTVLACLLVASHHFSKEYLLICSDGAWEEWREGVLLYERVLKRTANNPIVDFSLLDDGDKNDSKTSGKPVADNAGQASSSPANLINNTDNTNFNYFGIAVLLVLLLFFIFKK